jgi:UDP-N-acetylmuramoylalanine--D-glutamate ligase
VVPVVQADTMDHAVACAAALARPGDAVVLSPACSSFDMFRNYEHRAEAFRAAVARVAGR